MVLLYNNYVNFIWGVKMNINYLIKKNILLFAVIAFSSSAFAQIEEIVVTARKKSESLQDIPVQVDVLTGEEILRKGVTSLEDVSKLSSGLVFDNGFTQSDTRISLRGLSPIRGRQNVAVLQDGVDLSSENLTTAGGTALINPRLFDLERVEVVKGPQSALYGRSAFAGAINYITKKPTQEGGGNYSATIASENEVDLRLSWSTGISDSTAMGINIASWSRDGYHDNSVTGEKIGGEEGTAAAITFNYEPSDDFSLVTRMEVSDDDIEPAAQFQLSGSTMLPVPSIATEPVNVCIIPAGPSCLAYYTVGNIISPLVTSMPSNVGILPDIDDLGGAALNHNPRTGQDYPGMNREITRFSMTAVKEYDNFTFTSVTGFSNADVFTFEDAAFRGDASLRTHGGEIYYDQSTETHSQELRIQSNNDGEVRWTFGMQLWDQEMELNDGSFNAITYLETRPWFPPAFLYNSIHNNPITNGNSNQYLGAVCAPGTAGGEASGCLTRGMQLWSRDGKHESIYAMFEFDITDNFTLSIEGRYSEEQETVCGSDGGGTVDPNGVGFAGPGGATRLTPGMWTYRICGDHKETLVTPKMTGTYTVSDDLMIYGSASSGKKPGGISTVTGGGFSIYNPDDNRFESEEMMVYELGIKSTLMDGRLQLNGDIFLQDFTDKQAATQVVNQTTGLLQSKVVNAASAEVKGIELDMLYLASDNLSLTLSYTHLNNEYGDFRRLTAGASNLANAGNCTVVTDSGGSKTCSIDLSGNPLENAPENAFVLGASYNWDTADGRSWVVEADVVYQDERYIDSFKRVSLDSYYKVDLRAGWVSDDFEVIAYVENAFDDTSTRSGYGFTDFEQMKFVLGIPKFCGVAGPGAGSGVFYPTPCVNAANIGQSNGPSTFVLPTSHAMFFPDGRRYGIRIKKSF
ncbi:MAG: hypothetical protein CM1200mP17_01660 [Woeseia sp.]|jgi:outer membrane receptor protein involved in Fe transport|nr:MAG: hypothetical protein CM1200mP17_01660 [Woeseia sp.]